MSDRPTKITFGDLRDMGVRGILVYCADYKCSHSIAVSSNHWPDEMRPSDLEPRFVCRVCGAHDADIQAVKWAPAKNNQNV